MPNWCYQTITVKGPREEQLRLVEETRIQGDEPNVRSLRLANLVPLDPRAIKMISSSGSEYSTFSSEEDGFDGYMHALEIWGSKWGDCETAVTDEECEQTILWTKSAWSPINNLLINISKQFPALAFCSMYSEEFNHFAGCILIKDGRILDEYQADVEEVFFSKGLAPSTIDEEHERFLKAEEKLHDLISGASIRMISDLEKVLG